MATRWALDDELFGCIKPFCYYEHSKIRFGHLEAAQVRAQEINLSSIDFIGAIPKCFPELNFKPAEERLVAYRGALANPKLNGNTLGPTVLAMGWPGDSSCWIRAAEFADLLLKGDYKVAEKMLWKVALIDPMLQKAATERLDQLKAAKPHATKFPW